MFTEETQSILRDKLGRGGDYMEHSYISSHNIRYEGLPREGGVHKVISVFMRIV